MSWPKTYRLTKKLCAFAWGKPPNRANGRIKSPCLKLLIIVNTMGNANVFVEQMLIFSPFVLENYVI